MITRFLCVLVFLFPLAAFAQQDEVMPSPPDLSGVSQGSAGSQGPLPEGTAKGHAIAPPGMNTTVPNMEESCAKPMSLIGQPKSVLETMKFGSTVRILGPDSAATMDFSPSRTNIFYDKQGIITEIRCG